MTMVVGLLAFSATSLPLAARRAAPLRLRRCAGTLHIVKAVAAPSSSSSSSRGPQVLPALAADPQQQDHDLQQTQQAAAEEQQAALQQQVESEAAEEYSLQTMEAAAASAGAGAGREATVVAGGPLGAAQEAIRSNPALAFGAYAAAGFLGVTFLITLVRMGLKFNSSEAKRGRTINKNKLVVDEITKFLPGNRAGLTSAAMGRLRFTTGFTAVEVFRKYLWFLLRERTFDQEAVDDLVALKGALGLSDAEVAEALRERAQRIYEKYGNVMLDTEGMSKAGVQRKATTRALFSKLQYLLDYEPLLASSAAETVSLRDIFGATEQDVARLRIVSLQDIDLDRLASLPTAQQGGSVDEPGAGGGAAGAQQ